MLVVHVVREGDGGLSDAGRILRESGDGILRMWQT